MNGSKRHFAQACARWALHVHRHPRRSLALGLALAVALAAGAISLRVDTSMEGLLTTGDAVRVAYDEFRAEFGGDERILVLVRAEPRLFDLAFLERLAALHEELEDGLPHLESIQSLVNARVTGLQDDSLATRGFLDPWPQNEKDLTRLAELASRQALYENIYFSRERDFAAIAIEVSAGAEATPDFVALAGFDSPDDGRVEASQSHRLLDGEQIAEINGALHAIVERHRASGLDVSVTGGPVLQHSLINMLSAEMVRFTILGFAAMAALLWLTLGRFSGVMLSIAVVAMSLGGVMGIMGWIGMPLTPISQVYPSLMLAVGVSGSVHLLSQFYFHLDEGADAELALAAAFDHSGPAVVLTSFTTALGLATFTTAGVAPIHAFGVTAPLGVALAMFFSFVVLPAGLAFWPTTARGNAASICVTSALQWLAAAAVRHPRSAIAAWLIFGGFSVASALELRPELAPLRWLPETHPTRIATELADERLAASSNLQVLLDLPEGEGAWLEPKRLEALAKLQRRLATYEVGDTRSGASLALPDIVSEVHRAVQYGEEAPAGTVGMPATREGVAQQLLLFEMTGSEALSEVSDPRYTTARLQVLMNFGDGFAQDRLARRIETTARELMPGVEVTTTGVPVLSARAWAAMTDGTLRSMGLSLAAIGVFMCLLTRRVLAGALAMIPNVLPILGGLALMHWAGISLDLFTSMIGTIAIGIAVDDTIHMIEGYRGARSAGAKPEQAVQAAVVTSGRALVITSAALILGFCVFTTAQMSTVAAFGVVSAAVIALALAADVSLMPALLLLLEGFPRTLDDREVFGLRMPSLEEMEELEHLEVIEECVRP